jgi:uncharacterized heparinase superfamily protein
VPGEPDLLSPALDKVADTAEEAAADQRRLAADARRLARHRRRTGETPTAEVGGIIRHLSALATVMTGTAAILRAGLVRQLVSNGLSLREVSRHMGLSHQRLSAVLRKDSTS